MKGTFPITKFVIAGLTSLATHFCYAQDEPIFPVPEKTPDQLFYMQRTPNANTIIYDLNRKDGELDKADPIHVYWIRYGDKGQQAELSGVQRKFAYGIRTNLVAPEKYEIRFNANKKALMTLTKGKDNEYHVFATIRQKPAILHKIYLKIDGGTFWSPNVEYAELTGTDPDSGALVVERVKIEK